MRGSDDFFHSRIDQMILETAVGEVQLLGNAGSIRVYVELGGSPNG